MCEMKVRCFQNHFTVQEDANQYAVSVMMKNSGKERPSGPWCCCQRCVLPRFPGDWFSGEKCELKSPKQAKHTLWQHQPVQV